MRVAVTALAAALATPVAAQADGRIVALPRDRFEPAELTIAAGERVTFANRDISVHDVVAAAAGSDGRPRFRSRRTEPGRESTVDGVDELTAGRYAFVCSLHGHMRATLVVNGRSGPAPPPGDEQPGEPPPDTTGPAVSARVLSVRGRRVRVRVRTDEAAKLVVRGRGLRTVRRSIGASTSVVIRLRARRRVDRSRLRVTVAATDAAGNRTVRRVRAR